MMVVIKRFIFAILLVSTTPVDAGDRFDVVGGIGFNWSRPKQARCNVVKAEDVKDLASCQFEPTGAFGLPLAYHTCPAKRSGELMVFRSRKECQEAFETMQANAP